MDSPTFPAQRGSVVHELDGIIHVLASIGILLVWFINLDSTVLLLESRSRLPLALVVVAASGTLTAPASYISQDPISSTSLACFLLTRFVYRVPARV